MLNLPRIKTSRNHLGFTLIEVLVAILVFGFGVLGVAGLGATSQKVTSRAYQSMLATWQLQDMMELMRANKTLASSTAVASYVFTPGGSVPDNPGCITTGCTTAEIAAYDLNRWLTATSTALPSGTGQVSRSVSGAEISYTLTVRWDGDRSGATGTECPTDTDDVEDLMCLQLSFQL